MKLGEDVEVHVLVADASAEGEDGEAAGAGEGDGFEELLRRSDANEEARGPADAERGVRGEGNVLPNIESGAGGSRHGLMLLQRAGAGGWRSEGGVRTITIGAAFTRDRGEKDYVSRDYGDFFSPFKSQ